MLYAANFEIRSECSIVKDGRILTVNHPRGLFRAKLRNITRTSYSTPFLLSVHLYFEAESLDDAKDAADERLADFLNFLSLATGGRLKRYRTKKIVQVNGESDGMKSMLMWGKSIDYSDPQPMLDNEVVTAIETLLRYDVPSALRRSLDWYRNGVNATLPDDQFMCFWFAVEILAEFNKPTEKVTDKCPVCKGDLYCESCHTHPQHRPYAKQAIRSLLKNTNPDCNEETIELLDKTRNSLMHGKTLKEIERSLPEPHEQIVDVLGRMLWMALMKQFPAEAFATPIRVGFPSTYIAYNAHGIANLKTVVPNGTDGDLDLDHEGVIMNMVPFAPPQSAMPDFVVLTVEQFEALKALCYQKHDYQDITKRISERSRFEDGKVVCMVLATDMEQIRQFQINGEAGLCLEIFQEITRQSEIPRAEGRGI